MKKKELRNVILKGKIRSSKNTIIEHELALRSLSKKNLEYLESGKSPWDWEKSKRQYNEAKEFLKTIK